MRKILYFYLYLFVVWGVYRYATNYSEVVDEFVVKPLLWLIPIAVIILFFEKKNVIHGIHLHFRTVVHDVAIGTAGALSVLSIFYAAMYIRDHALTFNPYHLTFVSSLPLLWISLATALVEEITFRGFIFSRLKRDRHYVHWANILTTILFVLIHIPLVLFVQDNSLTTAAVRLTMLTELSLIDGYLFHARSGLVAPIVSHTVWNYVGAWVV